MDKTNEVLTLRGQGLTPKEIARRLGLRPAAVTDIIRMGASQVSPASAVREVRSCWVSPGWSSGLGFAQRPVEWCDVSGEEGAGARERDGRARAAVRRPRRVRLPC